MHESESGLNRQRQPNNRQIKKRFKWKGGKVGVMGLWVTGLHCFHTSNQYKLEIRGHGALPIGLSCSLWTALLLKRACIK